MSGLFTQHYSLQSSGWMWIIFSADPLRCHQAAAGLLGGSHFQVSPQMFDRVLVRVLPGPLQDVHRFVICVSHRFLGAIRCLLLSGILCLDMLS